MNGIEKRFIFGLDLGQTNDYTAVIVLERHKPSGGELTYHCRHIERIPLGTSYPAIVDRVNALVNSPEIIYEYNLIVDQTGVGRPVFDMLGKAGLDGAIGVSITGGDSYAQLSRTEYRVAKRLLVSSIQAVLSSHRLIFAAGMPEVDVLQRELLDFRVTINDNANDIYAAREGKHDDLVLALALPLWWSETVGNHWLFC